jgi:hypothetical protein
MSSTPSATPTPIPAFAPPLRVDDVASLTGCTDVVVVGEVVEVVEVDEGDEVDDIDVDDAVDEE